MSMRPATLVLGAALLGAPAAEAQSLADRVGAAGDGAVVFSFAARAEVCGDGDRTMRIGRSYAISNFHEDRRPCLHGPVQVRLTVRDGIVERVESWVGAPREHEGRALGAVPAAEAAGFLLTVARRSSGRPAGRAVLAAVLADSAVVWPTLLSIVRESTSRREPARAEAALWLSRFAGAALGGRPTSLDTDEDEVEKDDVKLHAVFVLSQLPNREGIPVLLDVARSKADLAVRQHALFWLGQSGDPRAFTLFESLLRSPGD